jgi:hypothetical protein
VNSGYGEFDAHSRRSSFSSSSGEIIVDIGSGASPHEGSQFIRFAQHRSVPIRTAEDSQPLVVGEVSRRFGDAGSTRSMDRPHCLLLQGIVWRKYKLPPLAWGAMRYPHSIHSEKSF